MNGMFAGLPAWIDRNVNGKGAIHPRRYTIIRVGSQGKGGHICHCSRRIHVPGYLLRNTARCNMNRYTAIERERDAAPW
jgi:hypothetical protein